MKSLLAAFVIVAPLAGAAPPPLEVGQPFPVLEDEGVAGAARNRRGTMTTSIPLIFRGPGAA